MLTRIHRSKDDLGWTESCLRLRDFVMSYDGDYEVWRQHDLDRGHFTAEQKKYFQTEAVWLCTRCEDVGSENGKKLAHKAQDEKLLEHQIHARHSTHKAAKRQPSSAFDGLRQVINLVRGSKVTLARNIAYKCGLANGTRGKLVGVVYPVGAPVGSFPEALIVEVRVQDDLQTKMSVGQPVSVALDAFPGVKFDGSISAIPRTIVSQTGQTVRIPDATIDVDFDRDGVVMGMLARVNITLQVKDDVMKVPLSALKDLNERTFVETVVNEQRRSLPVVTGIRSDSEVEILSGLEEGQMIFTAP